MMFTSVMELRDREILIIRKRVHEKRQCTGQEVVHVFNADRNPDEVVRKPPCCSHLQLCDTINNLS